MSGTFHWGNEGNHQEKNRVVDRIMILVAVMVCVGIFLQASLIVHNKSSENVSMPSYILFLISSLVWMFYGMYLHHLTISLSGLVLSTGSIFALVASVSYRPGTTPGAFSTL